MSSTILARGARLSLALAMVLPLRASAPSPGSPAPSQQPPPQSQSIDIQSWIDREYTATRAASLTMAVAQDGRLLWTRSWGYADKERRVAPTSQTPYSLASVTKSITMTAVMRLVEQGKIDLDAPIDRYLGGNTLRGLGGVSADATVRRVASHVAGLPAYVHFYFADEPQPIPPLSDVIRRYGIIIAPPGERFVYSNFGYGLLQQAITQASGVPFDTYLQREIFGPLGMTHSVIGMPAPSAPQAVRYATDGSRLPAYDTDHPGASAVYSSAEDLIRFGFLHVKTLDANAHQRKILSDASIDAMQRRTPPSPFGLGWHVFDGPATGVLFHGGGMDGVSTVLFIVPAKRLVVVGLCSTTVDLPGRAAAEIIMRMVPGLTIKPPPPTAVASPLPSTLTGEWSGEVQAHNGSHRFRLSIAADGQLSGALDDQPGSAIQGVEWKEDRLRGTILADLGIEDARKPYRLRFELTPRSPDRLAGAISAWSFRSGGRAPDILPSFLTLARTR